MLFLLKRWIERATWEGKYLLRCLGAVCRNARAIGRLFTRVAGESAHRGGTPVVDDVEMKMDFEKRLKKATWISRRCRSTRLTCTVASQSYSSEEARIQPKGSVQSKGIWRIWMRGWKGETWASARETNSNNAMYLICRLWSRSLILWTNIYYFFSTKLFFQNLKKQSFFRLLQLLLEFFFDTIKYDHAIGL